MPFETKTNLLPKAQYQHFINLYRQVKEEGLESQTFNRLFRELYQAEVIAPFEYTDLAPVRDAWTNPHYNFSSLSLVQLQQHLNAIFYADRHEEGTIVCAYNSGVFEKIFTSMDAQIQALNN